MLKVGVTGGIGSGKTFVCRMLEEAGCPVFYCDLEAHRLMLTDASLREALCKLVGDDVYNAEGRLCKPVLSAYIRRGEAYAARVNAIVHPRVRREFQKRCEVYAEMPVSTRPQAFIMECALLYEAGFDDLVDFSVFVSAPQELRIRRLMKRDGIRQEQALQWMALQLPEEEKRARADIEICNDGMGPPNLERLLKEIRNRNI